MKNFKKGFTVIELIVSIALTGIIVIGLFQILVSVQKETTNSQIRTQILVKQSNLEVELNELLDKKKITALATCGTDCIQFTFSDGDEKILQKTSANVLTFASHKTEFVKGTQIGEIVASLNKVDSVNGQSVLTITIPIQHKLMNDDFSIRIVYSYNDVRNPIQDFL